MTAAAPAWIDAETIAGALPPAAAIDVLETALRRVPDGDGLDPEHDGTRTRFGTSAGELLQMPSAAGRFCGTKILGICPANEGTEVPVIQGVYVLFRSADLTPVAVLDGAALTTLRTPATSALAVRHLASPNASRLALFGTGVQAWGHVEALRAVLDIEHVDVVGRTPERVAELVGRITATGIPATAAEPDVVAAADVVVCATASPEPLFDGALVADHAVVAAIGSHDPARREVDSALVARAAVVVESRASALREAGDVVIPISEGVLGQDDLVTLVDVVHGAAPAHTRPRLFKGTGMPWQDLVTAGAVADRVLGA
ncbi:ornithine cyclodeaminase family protein [Actinomycetes bacterium KLBMP 9759]